MKKLVITTVAALLLATAPLRVGASDDGDIRQSCPPGQVPAAGFSDVPPGVHAAAIDCVVWWELTAGVGGGRYAPAKGVDRAAMATFVARLVQQAGYPLPAEPGEHFDDVEGSVHAYRINQLAEVGIVQGTAARRYEPGRPVTRAQMASFLVRGYDTSAAGPDLASSDDWFDDDTGSVHEDSINRAAGAGFVVGVGSRRYSPSAPVRRDQMASFLSRVSDTYVEKGLAAPPSRAGGPEPFQSRQWGLERIRAPEAWRHATGFGTAIAIVDTGIDPHHPELRSRLTGGASWVDCDDAPPCGMWYDAHGHGTHVAGIAAAPRDAVGIAGVAPRALLMPIRVLDEGGEGGVAAVAAGIRHAVRQGADVINLSLGPNVTFAVTGDLRPYEEAVQYAVAHNRLVVVAAGNDGLPLCDVPSFRDGEALCVGATDAYDQKTYYSRFGFGLDVVAPGGRGNRVVCDNDGDVLSTYAVHKRPVCADQRGYGYLSGTSMAAPHVAGVGALLAELGVRGPAAARRIAATADDLGPHGVDTVYGHGRVNAFAAVADDDG